MAKIIASIEFENEVLKSDIPVVVDFFANWCGPCKMLAPTMDELSEDYTGKVKIVKIDTDESSELARSYGVRSIPTLIFFKAGEVIDRQVGVLPKVELASKIDTMF